MSEASYAFCRADVLRVAAQGTAKQRAYMLALCEARVREFERDTPWPLLAASWRRDAETIRAMPTVTREG